MVVVAVLFAVRCSWVEYSKCLDSLSSYQLEYYTTNPVLLGKINTKWKKKSIQVLLDLGWGYIPITRLGVENTIN